jgi:hypothetical protein
MMEDDALGFELERVRAELAAARTEHARLGAKIAGLEAQSQALAKALPGIGGSDGTPRTAAPRTDAIVDILTGVDTEMAIRDVIAALRDSGREETYDNVAADLAYLADRGRIVRLRRGVYNRPDRIVIPLTTGSLNHSYIPLANHLGFFPADAVGSPNERDGQGAALTLHFAGLPNPVETDIAGIHKDFRRRPPIKQFFAHHGLRPDEKIAIEKIHDYEYRVLPVR